MGFLTLLAIIFAAAVIIRILVVASRTAFCHRFSRAIRVAIVRRHNQLKRSSVMWRTVVEWTRFIVHLSQASRIGRLPQTDKAQLKPCMKRSSSSTNHNNSNSFHSLSTLETSSATSIHIIESSQCQPPKQKRRVVFSNEPNGAVVTQHYYYDPWNALLSPHGRHQSTAVHGSNPFGSPDVHPLPRASLVNRQKTPPARRSTKVTRQHVSVPPAVVPGNITDKENSHVAPNHRQSTAIPAYKTFAVAKQVRRLEPWTIQFQKPEVRTATSVHLSQRLADTTGRIPLRSSSSITTNTPRQQELLTNISKILRDNRATNLTQPRTTFTPPPFMSPISATPSAFPLPLNNNWSPSYSVNEQPASDDQSPNPVAQLFTPTNATHPSVSSSPLWNSSSPWASPTPTH